MILRHRLLIKRSQTHKKGIVYDFIYMKPKIATLNQFIL